MSTCSQEWPCILGDGDCDDDRDCDSSLICGIDNCASGPSNMDCCTIICTYDSDCLNQECNTDIDQCRLDSYSTDWSKCSQDSPCSDGEGDCDNDWECKGSLVCGNDECGSGPSNMDCCIGKFVALLRSGGYERCMAPKRPLIELTLLGAGGSIYESLPLFSRSHRQRVMLLFCVFIFSQIPDAPTQMRSSFRRQRRVTWQQLNSFFSIATITQMSTLKMALMIGHH